MDLVGHGGDEVAQEVGGGTARDLLVQFDEGELGRAVDRHEQVELALGGADFGDVDVEVADRVGLELVLDEASPSTCGSCEMPCRCRQRCNDERLRCGMVGCSA